MQLRQARHAKTFNEWAAKLRNLSLTHPFSFRDVDEEAFQKLGSYNDVGTGHPCSPAARYLYRLCGVGSVVDRTAWGTRIDRDDLRRSIHRQLLRDKAREGPWLRLSNYCSGDLTGRRGFTWWSTLDLFPRQYQLAASRAGLPNDWVSPLPLVLRIAVARLAGNTIVRVPTVLNAFDGPIFDPTIDDPSPAFGNAITLENSTWLARGCDEYVLGATPVSFIDMLPIDPSPSPPSFGISTGEYLWNLVAEYQARQLKS